MQKLCRCLILWRNLSTSAQFLARKQSTEASYRKAQRESQRDFILSVLEAQPSARDSRFYLKSFAAPPTPSHAKSVKQQDGIIPKTPYKQPVSSSPVEQTTQMSKPLSIREEAVEDLLNPVSEHTGIVKIQGPFTDKQLQSICNGMVFLRRLGLVSIIVIDLDDWNASAEGARQRIVNEVMRVAEMIEGHGGSARPIMDPTLKRHRKTGKLVLDSIKSLRSAIRRGEIPVLPPFCLEEGGISSCISPNELIPALSEALAQKSIQAENEIDLTPVRIMIINREGGIPSHARGGTPHLSINLESEYEFICKTFEWEKSHPTALDNLTLMRDCLSVLPRTASAVVVSHRSPKALVANLVTNRPAHSPSLHMSAFPAHVKLDRTPTILRHGLPIRVHQDLKDVDLTALTRLLEASFGKTLNQDAYYSRLNHCLDFIIIAGDCAAVAIVTKEGSQGEVSYLDKFAVLPSLQGDGTVDFMWGALRDESFGLGLLDALNNNGGLEGRGQGVDLVWRSRANNPVNKWYFERSNGFVKLAEMGKGGTPGMLFWCDAEKRVESYEKHGFMAKEEEKRLAHWSNVVGAIKSCWK